MVSEQNGYVKFSGSEELLTQLETLDIDKQKKSYTIGVPRETSYQENRVPLAPKAAGLLIANGHRVLLEANAGVAAHFSDKEYSEAGVEIVRTPEEVFQADLVLKVAPPSLDEIGKLKSRQILISAIQMAGQEREYFTGLMSKKITALAFEYIKDKTGIFPVLKAMSEIVGAASVFVAAGWLEDHEYGKGTLFGGFPGISPTEVVILGAGTVAEYAARAAIGLGAIVKVFDNSIYKLRRLQDSVNSRLFTSILQPKVLRNALKTADVVIAAMHSDEGPAHVIITEEMVMEMAEGTIVIDVSIDQGGCVETSSPTNHKEPVFRKYGVTHYCVPNIASKYPRTASYALSNFFAPLLIKAGEEGGIEKLIRYDTGVRNGVYLLNGTLTKSYIGEYYAIPYQDIELLMAALR